MTSDCGHEPWLKARDEFELAAAVRIKQLRGQLDIAIAERDEARKLDQRRREVLADVAASLIVLRARVFQVADKLWANDPLNMRADRVFARQLYDALGQTTDVKKVIDDDK